MLKSLFVRHTLAVSFFLCTLLFLPVAEWVHGRTVHRQVMRAAAAQMAAAAARDRAELEDYAAGERRVAAEVQRLMFERDCSSAPGLWRRDFPGTLPRSMVIQPPDAWGGFAPEVRVRPWSFNPRVLAGGRVLLVCRR